MNRVEWAFVIKESKALREPYSQVESEECHCTVLYNRDAVLSVRWKLNF